MTEALGLFVLAVGSNWQPSVNSWMDSLFSLHGVVAVLVLLGVYLTLRNIGNRINDDDAEESTDTQEEATAFHPENEDPDFPMLERFEPELLPAEVEVPEPAHQM